MNLWANNHSIAAYGHQEASTVEDALECLRQLNSEHFRQFKIDPPSVDVNFANPELTHFLGGVVKMAIWR